MKIKFAAFFVAILMVITFLIGCNGIEYSINSDMSSGNATESLKNLSTKEPINKYPATTTFIVTDNPEVWHSEVLWTPLSVDAEYDTLHNHHERFYIGKYGIYDDNGERLPIDPDQKIAFGLDAVSPIENCDDMTEYYNALTEEEKKVYDAFQKYSAQYLEFWGVLCFEDWLEDQGIEVVHGHKRDFRRVLAGEKLQGKYGIILFFATEEQLNSLKLPLPGASMRIFGAAVEDFAP